jgi:gliding motility-associated lipoprotein GldH
MAKGKIKYSVISFIPAILLFYACTSNMVFTGSKAMEGKEWNLDDVAIFQVPVSDTLNSNNVSFTLRTGSSYPFRNIYLFVSTTSPDGKTITDTLQYNLADEKGKWYGKGFGDINELELPYKSNVFFPKKGNYQFTVRHGMRAEALAGVYDIGLRIEKISK